MGWIKPLRVKHALININEWRKAANDQGSKHLLPLLALLERGIGPGAAKLFNETPHEFDFWDKYFKLDSSEKPYFNPITLRRAEKGYPHSNSATIRKNTFALKWHAATRRPVAQGDEWELSEDYADIFSRKALQKSGEIAKIPVIDLAVILLRRESVVPETSDRLEELFRARFQQTEEDYRKIFEYTAEAPANLFTAEQPTEEDMQHAILGALIGDNVTPASAAPAPSVDLIGDTDDWLLGEVQQLLQLGTSGIILSGPPGTSKTFSAKRIARTLVRDPTKDIFQVQFHPSFGYEDFVEGYKPVNTSTSGFEIVPKTFVRACERARAVDGFVVFIIDEINRGDPARIFGELLTYLERSYRDTPVTLPFSGEALSIPANLLLLGTMNPHDRSVSHIDAAFVRRFDHIVLNPSSDVLRQILDGAEFSEPQLDVLVQWFESVQDMMPIGLGHTIFSGVHDIDSLKLIWRYRLRPVGEAILELNSQVRDGFVRSYEAMIARLEGNL